MDDQPEGMNTMKKTLLLASLIGVLIIASTAQARHSDGYLERIVIEGYVESIRGQVAYVEDDCGITFRVHLGPAWYWDERNFFLHSGSYVTIIAWQDPYDDYCYAGEIRGRDFCYDLCDGRGYPRWYDRHQCVTGWRPTRSFFDICFVITVPIWYDHHPHHRYWRSDCDDDWRYDHRRHWRDHDRGHDRDGRRGGGRYSAGGDDSRDDKPVGGGFNAQVEKPRYFEKQPAGGNGGNSIRIDKPRSSDKGSGYRAEKIRSDDGGGSYKIAKPRSSDKPSRSYSSNGSKSGGKLSRKETSVTQKS